MIAQQHPLVRWAAQTVPGRGRRLDSDGACLVVAPDLNQRDRIVISGTPERVQPLVEAAVAAHPDHYVLGEAALVRGLAGLTEVAEFGWMDLLPTDPVPPVGTSGFILDPTEDDVAALLAVANPTAWVQADEPAARRWVATGFPGALTSVGALAHCAVDVAFLGGVATLPERRGQGLSTAVCGALRDVGRAEHGTVALMVDRANAPAIAVYRRLGFRYRPVVAARISG